MKFAIYALIVAVLVGVGFILNETNEKSCTRLVQANDIEKAVQPCMAAAQQGSFLAQYLLGVMYAQGAGVTRDDEQAVKWYRSAAGQGHLAAQYNLGYAYHTGSGVAKNYREAEQWYRKAAERGYANAQHNLGRMYAAGEGVQQDVVQAYAWFDLAAGQGYAKAVKARGLLEEHMNPDQLQKAKDLARAYHEKFAVASDGQGT